MTIDNDRYILSTLVFWVFNSFYCGDNSDCSTFENCNNVKEVIFKLKIFSNCGKLSSKNSSFQLNALYAKNHFYKSIEKNVH